MEPSWKKSLVSKDPEERMRGIKSLVQTQDPRALQILKYIYDNDPDETVRTLALKGARFLHQKSSQEKSQLPGQQPPQGAIPSTADITREPAPPPAHKPASKPVPSPAALSKPTLLESDGPPQIVRGKTSQRDIQAANQKLRQALTQQMRGNNEKAFGYIAAAFKLNPNLKEDSFAVNLASSLTGLPQNQAIAAILDQNAAALAPTPDQRGVSALSPEALIPASVLGQDFGKENKVEQNTRELLNALLSPGEKLLAYSGGVLPGVFSNKPVAFGLTSRRLILQSLKRGQTAGPPLSIGRDFLESISLSKPGSRLAIKVLQGSLVISPNKPFWKNRNKSFPELVRVIPRGQPDQAAIVDQISAFQELGLINTAVALGKKAVPEEEWGTNPLYQGLKDQRLSYQVAAGFLLVNVLATFFFALLGLVSGLPVLPGIFVSAIIDILIGVNLWKGQTQPWAGWALVRAAAGAVIYGILYLSQGLYLDLLAQLSFCGAIILVLTGARDRLRVYTAIGIYAIGFLGIVTASFLFSLFFGYGG